MKSGAMSATSWLYSSSLILQRLAMTSSDSLEISFIVCQVVHHISQLSNRAKAGSLIVKTDQRDLFRAKLVQAVTFFCQISSLFAQSAQHAGSLGVCQYGC